MLTPEQIKRLNEQKTGMTQPEQPQQSPEGLPVSREEMLKQLDDSIAKGQAESNVINNARQQVAQKKSGFGNFLTGVGNFISTGVKSLGDTATRMAVSQNPLLAPLTQSKILPEKIQLPEQLRNPLNPTNDISLRYSDKPVEALKQGGEDILNSFPLEDVAIKLFGGLGKAGKSVVTKVGEVLTGVENSKLKNWFNLAKNSPEKIDALKETINLHPQEPFLGFAQKIADKLTTLKTQAQEAWQGAKTVFEEKFPQTTFDLSSKVGELKSGLNNFGLTLNQTKNKLGQFKDFVVAPKSKISGFTEPEVGHIQKLVDLLKNAKDYTTDDLLALRQNFDNAYNAVKYSVDGKPTKYHALVMELKGQAEKFIDGVLPLELKDANQLYKNYYDISSKLGNKIVDASGEVKKGAETFLGNIMNVNKGAERKSVLEAGQKLGIDVLDEANNLKNAKELSQLVPNSTKNRTMDVIRGVVGSKAFTAGAGAGAFVNPAIGVPALLLNILSSPKTYSGLIEILAGTSKKLPVSEALNKLSPNEVMAIQQVIKNLLTPRNKQVDTNSQ